MYIKTSVENIFAYGSQNFHIFVIIIICQEYTTLGL